MKSRIFSFFLASLFLLVSLCGCADTVVDLIEIGAEIIYDDDFVDVAVVQVPSGDDMPDAPESANPEPEPGLSEDGSYYSKEDVALYLWTYKKLPQNFITKTEARKLGWEGGSVEKYKKGAAIGGDNFGNYEGLLPEEHRYRECDIDTNGQDSRGAKRIVYAADFSLIYYTDDHYESFTLLYPEDKG